MYTPAFVEYLGTTLFVGTVAFTGAPLLILASLAVAIYLGGKISGGHFNPAITAWALLSGKLSQQKAISYFLAQFGGALTVWVMHSMIRV